MPENETVETEAKAPVEDDPTRDGYGEDEAYSIPPPEDEIGEIDEIEEVEEIAVEVEVDLNDEADSPPSEPKAEVSAELYMEMQHAYNYWHTHGYPEKASVLWECMEQRRVPPLNLLPNRTFDVAPETAVDPSSIDIPPRYGPKSTHEVWRAFAKTVLDMEETIIDALPKGDIIKILEDRGVIAAEK